MGGSNNTVGSRRNNWNEGANTLNPLNDQEKEQKGIIGKPGYRLQRKLNLAELEEHKSKNLCFYCHEKFTLNYDCPQKKKSQLFVMEVEGGLQGRV